MMGRISLLILNTCLAKNCHTWGGVLKYPTSLKITWPEDFTWKWIVAEIYQIRSLRRLMDYGGGYDSPPSQKKKNKRGVRFLLQKIEFKIPIHFGMLFFFFFLRQMCCILNYTIPLKPHPYLKCWKASNQIVTYKCITFLLWYSVP